MRVFVGPSFFVTYAVVQTFVCLLLLRLLDPYEHQPLSIVALLALWGAVGATAISAALSPGIRSILPAQVEAVFGSAIAAPVVEEAAKALALVLVFWLSILAYRWYRVPRLTGITDAMVIGAAVGIGFAFTEDVAYFLADVTQRGLDAGLSAFVTRRDFFGVTMLVHAMFTAIFGIGLGLGMRSRRWSMKILFPLVGLVAAMSLHAINNGLAHAIVAARFGLTATASWLSSGIPDPAMDGLANRASAVASIVDYAAFTGLLVFVLWWQARQRMQIRVRLEPDVERGLIDRRDLDLAPSAHRRLASYWRLMRIGELERARVERRLHIEMARLAFVRERRDLGVADEEEVSTAIQRVANLRAEKAIDVYLGGSVG